MDGDWFEAGTVIEVEFVPLVVLFVDVFSVENGVTCENSELLEPKKFEGPFPLVPVKPAELLVVTEKFEVLPTFPLKLFWLLLWN